MLGGFPSGQKAANLSLQELPLFWRQQLKQGCEAEGRLTAWLSFDDADNDPRRFFPHIRALVSELDPDAELIKIGEGYEFSEGPRLRRDHR